MRIQYNITTVGSPTLSNGILSNTSQSNYGIISEDFKPSSSSYEIVINLNCSDVSRNQYFFYLGDSSKSFGGISLNIDTSQLYIWGNNPNNQLLEGRGVTTLSSDTDYWIKFTFDGTNTYKMYLSTDGVNYTQEISTTSNLKITNDNNEPTMVGYDLDGSINLLNTYIKIGDTLWWRGATNATNIQLRHDTAANWTSVNPILLEGEVGIETDTRKQKFGDGSTAWNSLPYDKGSTALQSITSSDVTTALGYTPVDTSLSNIVSTSSTNFDGQWVLIDEDIANGYTLGASATQYWTISSLPNDGNKYEVLGTITASGTNPVVVLTSSLIAKPNRIITTSGASAVFVFPVSSNRQIGLISFNNTNSTTINYFRAYGYRRIGTNS